MTAHDLAFPLHALGTTATGLTKRELFAAMAMQGLLASFEAHRMTVQSCAPLSVKAADALLAELAKDGAP